MFVRNLAALVFICSNTSIFCRVKGSHTVAQVFSVGLTNVSCVCGLILGLSYSKCRCDVMNGVVSSGEP